MGKIYCKQVESINLQIFESAIFSQDANPSLISHKLINMHTSEQNDHFMPISFSVYPY